jgi:Ca2+-binding RTX toxin-like protein
MFLVDAAKGITFELIGTDFAYNGGHLPISGTIAEVNVLYTTNPADPTELTQDHLLVNSDGWNLDAASLISYVGQYTQNPHGAGLDGLDGIFGAASYNYVGGSFFNYAPSTGYDGLLQAGGLTSVFVASDHPDVFNGIPPTPYVLNPSPGTVDYSHTQTGGVTVDLQTGFTSGFAAAGDIFVSIDGLRGTDSADHLTGGDGWNVLEGGLGDDTLDGGAGSIGDIVSYQHATPGVGNIGVTVNLALQGTSQNTVQAGSDTLTNFRDILGSAGNDTLIGDGNDNFLIGGEGADALHGGGGIDIADYELASTGVTVSLAQPGLNTGEAAGDTYDSIESVTGSHFNDVLAGNSGNNTLWGLDGNDTFVFNATTGSGQDTIGDFVQGRDHIQLDYLAFTPGNTASFDAWAAGHVTQQSTGVLIDLNADGHHAGQDTIRLSFTPIVLSMNDFILAPGHP